MTPPLLLLILLVPQLASADPAPGDRADESDRQYRIGVSRQREGRVEEAIAAYRACLRLDPTRVQAYARLKEAYGRGRTADQLITKLRESVERESDDFVAWNLLGVLYGKRARWRDAVVALERAVQLQPRDVDAWTNLGWLYSELKQFEKARDAFARALALAPGYGRAHAGMAGLHAEERGDYDGAIEALGRALSAEPDNAAYLYDLGWAYYRKGMTDRALDILTRAATLSPDDAAGRAKLGWAHLRRGEHQAAIGEFRRSLHLEPGYSFARFGLGRAFQAEGRGGEAIAEYRQAWRESRNDLYLIYLAGLYLQRFLWLIPVGVGVGMITTLVWLFRRRRTSGRTDPVPGQ